MNDFAYHDLLLTGMLALVGASGYGRPGELFSLRGRDLLAPIPSKTAHWASLIRSEEYEMPTKTGDVDDSVMMHASFNP